jgi:DNA-nicking Smr family endonuclease
MEREDEDLEAVDYPIDGILDLHLFRPGEVKELVADYLDECLKVGILDVRIIHGKGRGVLRRIVHSVLAKHPKVVSYGQAPDAASWGATVVKLASNQ